LRRFAPDVYASGFRVKPGMTTHFFASPGVGFGIARRNPIFVLWRLVEARPAMAEKGASSKKNFVIPGLTRNPVRQSNLAALRTGENDSGFQIKSGMTSVFFASPGVGFDIARRNPQKQA
jgi:hypothetical protein